MQSLTGRSFGSMLLVAERDHFDTEQNKEVCSRLSAGFAAFRSGRDERKHLEQIKQCLPFAFLLIFLKDRVSRSPGQLASNSLSG